MKKVTKILLFTASACPMGRTMGAVLREVGERCKELIIDTYYIDIHIDHTNHYRIKQNPTTLFMSDDVQELYRVEGFKEAEEILNIIDQIHANQLTMGEQREENRETIEKYVIYLYQEEALVPIEMQYTNVTSVKTPRITLIKLLLHAQVNGLENPFPPSTILELVQFKESKGIITLKEVGQPDQQDLTKMKKALEKSLDNFGIEEVEIICCD